MSVFSIVCKRMRVRECVCVCVCEIERESASLHSLCARERVGLSVPFTMCMCESKRRLKEDSRYIIGLKCREGAEHVQFRTKQLSLN